MLKKRFSWRELLPPGSTLPTLPSIIQLHKGEVISKVFQIKYIK